MTEKDAARERTADALRQRAVSATAADPKPLVGRGFTVRIGPTGGVLGRYHAIVTDGMGTWDSSFSGLSAERAFGKAAKACAKTAAHRGEYEIKITRVDR